MMLFRSEKTANGAEKTGLKILKVGTLKKHEGLQFLKGFILVEVIVSLAVLSILLPAAYCHLRMARAKFQNALLAEKAALIAQFELSKLELELTAGSPGDGNNLSEILDENQGHQLFDVDHEIVDRGNGMKSMHVVVSWETSMGKKNIDFVQEVFLQEMK